ncbi:MAG: hypothetical protein V5A18_00260 [Haloarculaceae archaeon]
MTTETGTTADRSGGVEAGPAIDVTARRVGGGDGSPPLRYDLTVRGLSNASAAWVLVAGGRGEDLTGLRRDGTGGRLEWTGSRDPATLSIVPEGDPASGRGLTVVGEAWSFGPVPTVVVVWRRDDGTARRSIRPFDERDRPDVTLSAPAGGFVGQDVALLGDATTHVLEGHGRDGGGTLRVLVPDGVEPRARPANLLAGLARASSAFASESHQAGGGTGTGAQVGDSDGGRADVGSGTARPRDGDNSTLVVLPATVRPGGATFVDSDEGWINADAPLEAADNVWLHEYVHVRQDVDLGPGMRWYREASAEYLAARFALERGLVGERAYLTHLAGGAGADTPLANRSAWPDGTLAYTRGSRVLAALDRELRAHTGANRSLLAVFDRLNRYDGTVTVDVFESVVSGVAGTDMSPWLDRHVAGTHAVEVVPPTREPEPDPGEPARPLLSIGLVALGGVVLSSDRFRMW